MGTVIGLVGFIGSGKGTVGDILVKKHNFIADSFAKPLKDAVSVIFNWDRKLLEGDTDESRKWREQPDAFWSKALNKPGFTPRLALQWMGTEAGRNVFGQGLWTSALINRLDKNKDYVITDVRFVNEVNALIEIGAPIVRVMRGEDPKWVNVAKDFLRFEPNHEPGRTDRHMKEMLDQLPHRSEWDWVDSPVNHIIVNNGTLQDLEASTMDMLVRETSIYW